MNTTYLQIFKWIEGSLINLKISSNHLNILLIHLNVEKMTVAPAVLFAKYLRYEVFYQMAMDKWNEPDVIKLPGK